MNTLIYCRIGDARLRRLLYARLKNRGASPAQGFFECKFTPQELADLQEYLRRLELEADDCVIVHSICAACRKKRLLFGAAREEAVAGGWLVV